MNLWQEMLCRQLENQRVEITFPQIDRIDLNRLLETESYIALQMIKNIIRDETLDDKDCFEKIEEIIRVLESIGSNGGLRHDFG